MRYKLLSVYLKNHSALRYWFLNYNFQIVHSAVLPLDDETDEIYHRKAQEMRSSEMLAAVTHSTQALVTTALLLWSGVCHRRSQINAPREAEPHSHTCLISHTFSPPLMRTQFAAIKKEMFNFLALLSGQRLSFRKHTETRPCRWMDSHWHILSPHSGDQRGVWVIYSTAGNILSHNTTQPWSTGFIFLSKAKCVSKFL